jgi:hypothetical protein
MDLIEHFFGVSPDGGSGSFETAFAVGLIGIVALLGGALIRKLQGGREQR